VGLLPELAVLGFELLALEAGEPAEAHVEDRLGLALRQVDEAGLARGLYLFGRPAGALEEAVEPAHALGHQAGARLVGVLRRADDLDDAIDLQDGEAEAFDDLAALARLPQLEPGAPG